MGYQTITMIMGNRLDTYLDNKLERCFHGYLLDKKFPEASEIKYNI